MKNNGSQPASDPSKPHYRIKLLRRRTMTGEHVFATRKPTEASVSGYIEWNSNGGFAYRGKTILACRPDNRLY